MIKAVSLPLLATLLVGCGALDNCPDGQSEPIVITTGKLTADGLGYESAPSSGPLHAFPAKTALAFEHGLGFTPHDIDVQLSFSEHGTNGANAGSIAPTAGNQTLFDCIDSNVIVIRNDTCEKSFYIRVTTSGVSPTDLRDECSRRAEP